MENKDLNREITYEVVYKKLFTAILTGQLEPGKAITIRGLAKELGVSPMPIRETIRRLIALGALEMTSTRRVIVARMTEERFHEILAIRTLLEPEISVRALTFIEKPTLKKLILIDAEIEHALKIGDADAYCIKNCEFHFTIYKAANSPIMLRLIESVWLQFGPFMRVIIGRLGTSYLVDQHAVAMTAIKERNESVLREAILSDIHDGMDRIAEELYGAS